jgi:hypothetical protein
MAAREKPKPNSGYDEPQPKPSPAGTKLPGTGNPRESQNMPKKKPGKGSSP